MQRDSIKFAKVKDKLVEHGQVSFNVFDYTIRKNKGYLVTTDFYFEDLIDVTTFEKVFEEVEKNIADLRQQYQGEFDFEKALYADITAFDSFYMVTLDFWFEEFKDAETVAEQFDIPSEDIFDVAENCYIYDKED